MSDRPAYCCGAYPAVELNPAHIDCEAFRTGYDCTCRDNPNCPNYQETPMTEMNTWRKKPVTIHAVRLTADNAADIVKMINGTVILDNGGPGLLIDTLEGLMRATPGDYIIRGVAGEFYPCRSDIFHRTYERTYQETPNE